MMRKSVAFSDGFTQLLAMQVQHYRAHIEIVAIRSSKERVVAAIKAGYFDGPITALASRINLTHEACYRALGALCNDGVMVRTGRGRYEWVSEDP